jgi:hypothetical protein
VSLGLLIEDCGMIDNISQDILENMCVDYLEHIVIHGNGAEIRGHTEFKLNTKIEKNQNQFFPNIGRSVNDAGQSHPK